MITREKTIGSTQVIEELTGMMLAVFVNGRFTHRSFEDACEIVEEFKE